MLKVSEEQVPQPTMVDHPYMTLPHPIDYRTPSVEALFTNVDPKRDEAIKRCSQVVDQIQTQVVSMEEQKQTLKEWLRKDPSSCHWYFYSSFKQVEQALAQKEYIDEKQKITLEAYSRIVAIAQAFHEEYTDPRYLYFASVNYQRVSQMVFYRKLDLAPETTLQMTAYSTDSTLKPEKDLETPMLNKVLEQSAEKQIMSSVPLDEDLKEVAVPDVSESLQITGRAPSSSEVPKLEPEPVAPPSAFEASDAVPTPVEVKQSGPSELPIN
jgi:hypothetical protein